MDDIVTDSGMLSVEKGWYASSVLARDVPALIAEPPIESELSLKSLYDTLRFGFTSVSVKFFFR